MIVIAACGVTSRPARAIDPGRSVTGATPVPIVVRAPPPSSLSILGEAATPWPYDSFGTPGRVLWRRGADLGVTQVAFANGVRLNVKSTTFASGQVLVTVRIAGGWLSRPPGRPVPSWLAGAVVGGGTTELSYADLRRSLKGAHASEQMSMTEDALLLSGVTSPEDLSRQLQWMTATLSRPAYRSEGLARLKTAVTSAMTAASSTPRGVLDRDLPLLLHGGDERWLTLPTAPEVERAGPEDVAALVGPALRSGPIEVTIVGDVTPDTAIALAAATVGTLPKRGEIITPPPAARTIHAPAGGARTLLHTGRADMAITLVEWPTRDFHADPHEARVLDLAERILRARLTDHIAAQGLGAYAAGGGSFQSADLMGFGYLDVAIEIPPWRTEDFQAAALAAAEDLGKSGPTLDELGKALTESLEASEAARKTNRFWLTELADAQADPRVIPALRDEAADKRAVTAAEIAAAARRYLTAGLAWKLDVRSARGPRPALEPGRFPARPPGSALGDGWPQTFSDLTADPDVRFGVLPNGMRYAIRHDGNPPDQTSIRFRIAAGALEEREDQLGLAHFLEHMAFKGSTHVGQDEMVRILQRQGLAFGPDANAFTQKDQTFYKLDLPKSDDAHLDTGLMLMREIGSELLISQTAMDAERGVILSEERLNESPAAEADKTEQAFYFEGQLAGRRDPMGSTQVISRAPASRVRAFYDAYYRPENATLIVVGDIDVDAVEKKIIARFGDWRGRGAPGPRPDLGVPKPRGETVRLIVRDGLPLAVAVAWTRPADDRDDSFARQRADLVSSLGLDILSKRLSRKALGADAPYVGAQASRSNAFGSARVTQIGAVPNKDGLGRSLDAIVEEQRRLVAFGAEREEFLEALKARRDALGSAVPSSVTNPSGRFGDQYLQDVHENRVIMSAAGALAQFDAEARNVTLEEVNAALKTTFVGAGPLIMITTPTPIVGGEAAVRALYDGAVARPVTAKAAEVIKAWPYDSFGAPGKVVMRRAVPDLGVTQVRFANGVRLNIRPTTFGKNQVSVMVRIGGGLLALPPGTPGPAWLLGALGEGGTRELSSDEIQRSLKGLGVSFNAAFADDALVLSGATGPRDFPKQMELLAAMISRPGYRPEAVEHLKNRMAVALPTLDFTPQNVLGASLPVLVRGGDTRWSSLPTPEALAAAKASDLPALLDADLKSGAMEVTVVGDVSVERAIFEVARTLGALPSRGDPKPVPASSPTLRPPVGGATVVLRHRGRSDQAIAYVEWPTADFYADPHEAHVLVLAAEILQNRLIDRIRLREGATYAPSAGAEAASEEIGFGFVQAFVEIPPARIDGFFRDIDEIVADMGRAPPSADELLRARAPLLASITKSRETLEFWTDYINHSQADPRELESIRRKLPDFESITAAEISAVCRKYMTPQRAWRLVVKPESPATATKAGR